MISEQHVVIVGGSSGIGLSTARLLLGQGYKVTITGRSASRLASARDTLSGDIHTFAMNAAQSRGYLRLSRISGVFPIWYWRLAAAEGRGLLPQCRLRK